MKLSIIVPVYNVIPYLARCVDSLYDQGDFDDYQVILVDDGSTDGGNVLCDEYAKTHAGLSVIHQENAGLSAARNAGLRIAQGDYILFVDADDYIKTSSLASLVACADEQALDVLCFDYLSVYDTGRMVPSPVAGQPATPLLSGEQYLLSHLSSGTLLFTVWKALYRRDFLLDNDLLFREGYVHEDEEWSPRVFLRARRVRQVPDCVYAYCLREGGLSRTHNRRAAQDLLSHGQQLALLYSTLSSRPLREGLENYLATLCLSAFYKGRLIDQAHTVLALCDNLWKEKRNQRKCRLLRRSPRLYLWTNDTVKHLTRLKTVYPALCHTCRAGLSRTKYAVQKFLRRHLVSRRERALLTNHRFSLISHNCNGGVITSELGEPFRSPTVNLWLEAADFIRFCERLPYYLSRELQEVPHRFVPYPVGRLDDVTIYFMHYHSFEEAKQKWETRTKRVDFDHLFFMMTQRNGCDDETVAAFDRLPYPNKVIFTAQTYPMYSSAVALPAYSDHGEVGILTDFVGLFRRKYDVFDYVSWLNRERPCPSYQKAENQTAEKR